MRVIAELELSEYDEVLATLDGYSTETREQIDSGLPVWVSRPTDYNDCRVYPTYYYHRDGQFRAYALPDEETSGLLNVFEPSSTEPGVFKIINRVGRPLVAKEAKLLVDSYFADN